MTSDPRNVDMSPGAIADRIHEVAALNRLCESLARAGEHLEENDPARVDSSERR